MTLKTNAMVKKLTAIIYEKRYSQKRLSGLFKTKCIDGRLRTKVMQALTSDSEAEYPELPMRYRRIIGYGMSERLPAAIDSSSRAPFAPLDNHQHYLKDITSPITSRTSPPPPPPPPPPSEHQLYQSIPQPLITPPRAIVSTTTSRSPSTASEYRPNPATPQPFVTPTCRILESSPVSKTASTPPLRLRFNSKRFASVDATYETMLEQLTKKGLDPNSYKAVLYYQAAQINEVAKLNARLDRIEKGSSCHAPVTSRVSNSSHALNLPFYKDEADLKKEIPDSMLQWLKREGGASAREHIYRCLKRLMTVKVQRLVNRGGVRGKLKFPSILESLIYESSVFLFPTTTRKEVEYFICRFLAGSRDRDGGSLKRKEDAKKLCSKEIETDEEC